VRYQIAKNLQQKPLGHFAIGSQAATWHGALLRKLSQLQRRSDGIRNGAGELHEVNPFFAACESAHAGLSSGRPPLFQLVTIAGAQMLFDSSLHAPAIKTPAKAEMCD